jgi:hypothetical protein
MDDRGDVAVPLLRMTDTTPCSPRVSRVSRLGPTTSWKGRGEGSGRLRELLTSWAQAQESVCTMLAWHCSGWQNFLPRRGAAADATSNATGRSKVV